MAIKATPNDETRHARSLTLTSPKRRGGKDSLREFHANAAKRAFYHFISVKPACCRGVLYWRQLGILNCQPFCARFAEIYLHPHVRAPALDIENHSFAELGMLHRLADAPARG